MSLTLAQPFVIDEIGKYIKPGASVQPNRAQTRYVVIHHAAADYPKGQACQKIFQAHSTRPDFDNYYRIGYHEVIQREMDDTLRAHLVNPPEMQGAGVYQRNDVCYHICAATNFINLPDPAYIEALAQRAAAALARYPGATVVGHTEITVPGHGTTCPGSLWQTWKPALLKRIGELLPSPAPKFFTFPGLPVYRSSMLIGEVAVHIPDGAQLEIDVIGGAGYSTFAGHIKRATWGSTELREPGFVDIRMLKSR